MKLNENEKVLSKDAKSLYGWAMSDSLLYDEINFDKNVDIENTSSTPDDSDIGYFLEINLETQNERKEKSNNFPFCPEKK